MVGFGGGGGGWPRGFNRVVLSGEILVRRIFNEWFW